ncbi:MAG TPA: cardiolipin synthase [Candidatus Cloacimonadota bacterium]|nr:cardiolipin synthase [Candidatus Cloacimonadota bacterium]
MKRILFLVFIFFIISILFILISANYIDNEHIRQTKQNLITFIDWIFLFIIVSIILLVIRENTNPVKSLAWIQVLIFLPVIGFILYIVFGINYRKKKIFNKKSLKDAKTIDAFISSDLTDNIDAFDIVNDQSHNVKRLIRLMYNNSKAILCQHNEMEFYYSGADKLDALFNDIQKAKKTIHLEYFTIKDDQTGLTLQKILIQKLKEGVKVRIIYDAVGSWRTKKKYWKKIIQSGGECYSFSPAIFPLLSSKLNYRDHRKIAIIDGTTAYIGGVNIGNQYIGISSSFSFWRDTHLRIKGDSSHVIQQMFLLDWLFVSKKNEFNKVNFPAHQIQSVSPVQIVSSGPDSDWENIHQAYFEMICSARNYLYIQTPYMFLDESILMALKITGLAGVDVRIILPHKPDHIFINYGTKSYYYDLLDANVKLYEYTKGFIHAKVIIVDDEFCSVGSANLDIRSFSQNFEMNALLYDSSKVIKLKEQFFEDLENCVCINKESVNKKNKLRKFLESFARLFSPIF